MLALERTLQLDEQAVESGSAALMDIITEAETKMFTKEAKKGLCKRHILIVNLVLSQ